MKRSELLNKVAEIIAHQHQQHPLRVGIDGTSAAGKTFFANELASQFTGRRIIRASIDDFHNPRAIRYARGRLSPKGYYQDSFDNARLIDCLLKPLGYSSQWNFVSKIFDYKKDRPVAHSHEQAQKNDILIFDGIFLFRPELKEYWDVKIFVDVDFPITVTRAIDRAVKQGEIGRLDISEIIELYEKRYIPGQKLYFKKANPKERADIVIDNNNPINPALIINSVDILTSKLIN